MTRRLSYYILSLCDFAIGVFLFIKPDSSMLILSKIIGIALIIYAVVRTISMFIAEKRESLFTLGIIVNFGIFLIGLLMIGNVFKISSIIGLIISIYIIASALWKLRIARVTRKFGISKWWIILLISFFSITMGAISLLNLNATGNIFIRIIALGVISDAILNISSLIFTGMIERKKAKKTDL